jgi:hypothetical protein
MSVHILSLELRTRLLSCPKPRKITCGECSPFILVLLRCHKKFLKSLFAMSEFRNKPATEVLSLGLVVGSEVLICPNVELPRNKMKRKQMPPIQLD